MTADEAQAAWDAMTDDEKRDLLGLSDDIDLSDLERADAWYR